MKHFTIATTLVLVSLTVLHAADAPPAKPNILWIVMDDVGVELPCGHSEKSLAKHPDPAAPGLPPSGRPDAS